MPTFRRDMINAFRPSLAGPISQALVDTVDIIFEAAGVPKDSEEAAGPIVKPPAGSTGLPNEKGFFDALKAKGGLFEGGVTQSQLDGIRTLLVAFEAGGWGLAFTANGLATAYLETNKSMQPVAEAYYLGERAEAWRRAHLRYYPWYGRGYPQVTWERNYRAADAYLAGLGLIQAGELVADPNKMLQAELAAPVMVKFMTDGTFTGKRLGHSLPESGPGNAAGHKEARRVINGTDRWDDLARYAMAFQAALQAGGMAQ